MTRDKFIQTCELIKKSKENLIAARELNIGLEDFSEIYSRIIDNFGKASYGFILWETALDFIYGGWDGKIYNMKNHKLIKEIRDFGDLWDYFESMKDKNGKIIQH